MDEIPEADRDEMELDRAPNSDFEDSEESDDDREEEEEDKEAFVPGKHKLEEGEELVRDTRLAHYPASRPGIASLVFTFLPCFALFEITTKLFRSHIGKLNSK